MTFADLERIPDSAGRFELRHGELAKLTLPKHEHFLIQRFLREALGSAAAEAGVVDIELGFRPKPEHEYWKADVAYVSRQRWLAIPRRGNLQGVPEIVIEVLSPSNTASEMLDREQICLEKVRRQVRVSTPDGRAATYKAGREIPLLFGGSLPVDPIFA
jgi:Uma2 family endonuclease